MAQQQASDEYEDEFEEGEEEELGEGEEEYEEEEEGEGEEGEEGAEEEEEQPTTTGACGDGAGPPCGPAGCRRWHWACWMAAVTHARAGWRSFAHNWAPGKQDPGVACRRR